MPEPLQYSAAGTRYDNSSYRVAFASRARRLIAPPAVCAVNDATVSRGHPTSVFPSVAAEPSRAAPPQHQRHGLPTPHSQPSVAPELGRSGVAIGLRCGSGDCMSQGPMALPPAHARNSDRTPVLPCISEDPAVLAIPAEPLEVHRSTTFPQRQSLDDAVGSLPPIEPRVSGLDTVVRVTDKTTANTSVVIPPLPSRTEVRPTDATHPSSGPCRQPRASVLHTDNALSPAGFASPPVGGHSQPPSAERTAPAARADSRPDCDVPYGRCDTSASCQTTPALETARERIYEVHPVSHDLLETGWARHTDTLDCGPLRIPSTPAHQPDEVLNIALQ